MGPNVGIIYIHGSLGLGFGDFPSTCRPHAQARYDNEIPCFNPDAASKSNLESHLNSNGNYYSILGLYRDDGKPNGNYYSILGLYRDDRKPNGNYYSILGLYGDDGKPNGNDYSIDIMENEMETTIVFADFKAKNNKPKPFADLVAARHFHVTRVPRRAGTAAPCFNLSMLVFTAEVLRFLGF